MSGASNKTEPVFSADLSVVCHRLNWSFVKRTCLSATRGCVDFSRVSENRVTPNCA